MTAGHHAGKAQRRKIWNIVLGVSFLVLGIIGIIIPVMPQIVFFFLSAVFFFARLAAPAPCDAEAPQAVSENRTRLQELARQGAPETTGLDSEAQEAEGGVASKR